MFLHSSHFIVSRAHEMLQNNYAYRVSGKKYFEKRDPFSKELKKVQDTL